MSYELLLSERLFCGLDEPISGLKSMLLSAGRLRRIGRSRATFVEVRVVVSCFLAYCTCEKEERRVQVLMIGGFILSMATLYMIHSCCGRIGKVVLIDSSLIRWRLFGQLIGPEHLQ